MIIIFLNRPDREDTVEMTVVANVREFNSSVRLRTSPDKMATSNGGGMEVDGAGKYFSLIRPFLNRNYLNICGSCRKLCVYPFVRPLLLTL